MNFLFGYIIATLIGAAGSQTLLQLLQNLRAPSSRLIQVNRNVPSRTLTSQATSSSSVGLASSLGVLDIQELLNRIAVQPRTTSLGLPRGGRVVRQRPTFILSPRIQTALQPAIQAVPAVPDPVPAAVAGVPGASVQPGGVGTTVLFDRPDPHTPEAPDLVYAPRSMMGDMQQVEALRKRTEADGVVFV
ncbi:hypothetical protein ACF0H5_024376 [Mactra antiquata]